MSDLNFVRQPRVEGRSASAVLLVVCVSLVTVAAFTITLGGATTRRSGALVQPAPSAGNAHSNSRLELNSPEASFVPVQPDSVAGVAEPVVPNVSSVETIVGYSVEGRPLVCRTIGDGEYIVLMLASIHGNESAGTPLLNRLAEYVVANSALLDGVTLVLLPVVNPDGVENRGRYNTRGVDLNRNFPAENRENSSRYGLNALSEPEALAVYQVMNNTLPDHIVTLHEPLQCVDYDGPAESLATAMSEFCPLPVKKLGSRPGSLGSYAGVTLGIPTVTLELPRNAAMQPPELLWRFYGEALVQAVLHRHRGDE